MMTWPVSPIPPPPIARRSTPRAARASARVAIPPGSFFSWTTNWLAMGSSGEQVEADSSRWTRPREGPCSARRVRQPGEKLEEDQDRQDDGSLEELAADLRTRRMRAEHRRHARRRERQLAMVRCGRV